MTADRTLVVRGTTDLIEFIRGVVESFGLSSPNDDTNGDGDDVKNRDDIVSESLLR